MAASPSPAVRERYERRVLHHRRTAASGSDPKTGCGLVLDDWPRGAAVGWTSAEQCVTCPECQRRLRIFDTTSRALDPAMGAKL